MTDMEKYIKFLEAQLKTKNEKEKKSPQNKSSKDDNHAEKSEDTSTTKKFYSQSKPVREVKKENSTNDKELKKHPTEKTSPQSSSDDPFVKKSRVAHTPSTSKSSCKQNFLYILFYSLIRFSVARE
jgi:hypothetical protein